MRNEREAPTNDEVQPREGASGATEGSRSASTETGGKQGERPLNQEVKATQLFLAAALSGKKS